MARADDRRVQRDHRHLFVGRVRRHEVGGELAGISLDLIRDEDQVELVGGDEFVTVLMTHDPFASRPEG